MFTSCHRQRAPPFLQKEFLVIKIFETLPQTGIFFDHADHILMGVMIQRTIHQSLQVVICNFFWCGVHQATTARITAAVTSLSFTCYRKRLAPLSGSANIPKRLPQSALFTRQYCYGLAKHITHTAYRLDQARGFRVITQLLTQARDMNINRAVIGLIILPTPQLEQLIAA